MENIPDVLAFCCVHYLEVDEVVHGVGGLNKRFARLMRQADSFWSHFLPARWHMLRSQVEELNASDTQVQYSNAYASSISFVAVGSCLTYEL